MALRNAFEAMATEATLAKAARSLNNLVRNLNFAKTSSDQLRVVVDSGGSMSTSLYWMSGNTWQSYYGSGAPASMDAREQQAAASRANFAAVRNQRWSL